MGIHTFRSKPRARQLPFAVAAIAAALVLGCSAAGPPSRAPDPEIVQSAAQAVAVAGSEITSLEVVEEFGQARLVVGASDPLTWTSYRDADDNLVIELPGSVPGSEVVDVKRESGLVRAVSVEPDAVGGRQFTRLVVETAAGTEHSVAAHGSGLVVDFASLELVQPEATAAYIPVSYSDVNDETESAVDLASDQPHLGPAPEGVPATQLQGVDVSTDDSSTVVWVSGDGSFYYSTFTLKNPDRFVVDLIGVVNTSPVSTIAVQDDLVDGVRVAQFKPQPELVSRVVVDLLEESSPQIETTSDGMRLTFFQGAQFADQPADYEAGSNEIVSASVPMSEPVYDEPVYDDAVLEAENLPSMEVEPALEPVAEAAAADDAMIGEVAEAEYEIAAVEEAVKPAYDEPVVEETWEAEAEADEPTWQEPEWDEPAEEAMPAYEEPVAEAVAWEEPTYEEPSYDSVYDEPVAVEPTPEQGMTASEESLLDFAAVDLETARPAATSFEARDVIELSTPEYHGVPMTLTLRDADIKDVLRSFAGISGLNVVVQPEVTGTVTVELTDVPWDQALDQILKINGLGYQLEGNIMRVAPVDVLQREEEQKLQLEAAKARSVPLKTMMRRVSYASADEIASLLRSGGGASIMSARGSAVVDRRTNTLIIKELPSHIETVIAVIENLDIPEPQVMIEARIIETTKRFNRTLGVQWGFSGVADPRYGNSTDLQFPNRGAVDGGVGLLTGGSNGFLDITLGNVTGSFNVDMVLQAAESEGLINILSAPKIATLNNETASIQSGLQIPIQTIANNTVSVQFVNATLRLEVTPHVTAEGTVLMDIDIQKREPQLAFAVVGAANAPISTKDASTRVIVRDGGTTVIGGIYKVTSDQGEDRVPGLSNVPILKHLFKNKRRNDENEELLIFITPRVIRL